MDRLVYIKYSNERAKQFAICTEIRQNEDGKKYVVKRPYAPVAKKHVKSIAIWYEKLSEMFKDTEIRINHCELKGDNIILEYLEGRTLEEELDILLEADDYERFILLMKRFYAILIKSHSHNEFVLTEGFKKVFGELSIPEGLACGEINNIDMLFRNIIVNNGWNVIDYEWTFDFPIPINYVIYRAIIHYVSREKIKWKLDFDLFNEFNITEEEKDVYQQMERGFINYATGGLPSVNMLGMILNNKKIVVLDELERNKQEIKRRIEEVEKCKDEIRYYQEELQQVYQSTSWKVTKPLRQLREQIRKVKEG